MDGPADRGDIVVTGSRIVRNGYSAPTPLTVATTEQLQVNTPSSIPDGLNKLPQFSGSRGPSSALQNASNPYAGNYLNLRNVGIQRTLILLDGRRVPATTFDGLVDTNIVPQLLVQKVDVVTGGASAVYGSDAVTGVVNFVLDKNFSGLKGLVQRGISSRGDDGQFRVGLAYGTDVTERGHLLLSAEHYTSAGVADKADRPLQNRFYGTGGLGTAASPYFLIENTRFSNMSFGGLIRTGPLAGKAFNPDGTLYTFNPGTSVGVSNIASGGDGAYYVRQWLVARERTDQAFGRFQYQLTNDITAFVQGTYARANNFFTATGEGHTDTSRVITIYSGNAFLRPEIQQALGTTPSFRLNRFSADYGSDTAADATTKAFNATVGLNGTLGGYRWDAYYTRGESRLHVASPFNTNTARFYAAVDAVRDPGGNIVCRVTLTNPGLYPGCVPLNLFGDGAPSQAARNYILGTTSWWAKNTLDDWAANLTGQLFDLPAGPVSIAVGGEYRRVSLRQTTDSDPSIRPDFTGLRGGFTATDTAWIKSLVGRSSGRNSVWEINGEIVVPILRDRPFFNSLELGGAGRYTRYSTSGGVTTWSGNVKWEPVAGLRFRAVRSRDIRAPTLYDLFAGQQVANNGFVDPISGQTGVLQSLSQGNPALKPERADTLILGLVFQPRVVPRLAFSLDYYDIRIKDGIGTIGAAQAALECQVSNLTSPLCALFGRTTPTAYPLTYLSTSLNIASTKTHGLDAELSYNVPLRLLGSQDGRLNLRLLASYQPKLETLSFASAQLLNAAGAPGLSAYRLTSFLGYSAGPFSIDLQTRYKSSTRQSSNSTLVFNIPRVKDYVVNDLAVSYKFPAGRGGNVELFLNVSNLFDVNPPIYAAPTFTSVPGLYYPSAFGYDFIGRYFTAGARFKF